VCNSASGSLQSNYVAKYTNSQNLQYCYFSANHRLMVSNDSAVDQVETGSNSALALGKDGRVYGWGANDFGQLKLPSAALSGVRSISAGLGHVMAIKTNGDLVIWGRNDFKQTEAPAAARKGLSAIAAEHSHSLAVKNGAVIA
jgi:alpha-tubulin suppressor-like RCC1 family protein